MAAASFTIEIATTNPDAAAVLTEFVDRLNDAVGAGEYEFFETVVRLVQGDGQVLHQERTDESDLNRWLSEVADESLVSR